MPSPLNPTLFHQLQAQFGELRVSNAGQEQIARRTPDPMRPGRFITQASQRGEQYACCCPFCGDDRFRLYVSYLCGEKDPMTGRRNYRLWCCQNEKCHQSEANQQVFRSRLSLPIGRRRACRAAIATPAAAPQPPRPITLPENLIPITALPPTHPEAAYIVQRGFDLEELYRTWNVGFCDSSVQCRPPVPNRIIIPVYKPAQMFSATPDAALTLGGWQARLVPGLEPLASSAAKYLSAEGMQKAELLYGLHWAIQTTGPVYVVEGPTDCWRIGPGAVALFGKTLSATQKLLLVHHFAGRPFIVMLDPDAYEAAQRVQDELYLARGASAGENRVVLVDLPPGREDPADCTREEIFAVAAEALRQPARPGPKSTAIQPCVA